MKTDNTTIQELAVSLGVYPPESPAKEQAEARRSAAACSPLLTADDAPRDGTMILGDFGWPWMVPASWDADSERWAVAMWNASALHEQQEITETWWESDHEQRGSLRGWMPFPKIPENAKLRDAGESGVE